MKSINSFSIPKPCSENWNEMTETEQGKHCKVCAKTVVDFSKKSPTEISNYLSNSISESVCGRIPIAHSKYNIKRLGIAVIVVASMFPLLSFNTEYVNDTIASETKDIEFFQFKGTIKDTETREALPFAKIFTKINEVYYGAETDFDGQFTFQIPKNKVQIGDSLTITVKGLDYQDTVVEIVLENDLTMLDIAMQYTDVEFTLGVIIYEPAINPLGNPFETKIEQPFYRNEEKGK